MASEAQTAANRANATQSTGPRSADGKARSAKNNLRHGLRSQSALAPGDDTAEYNELIHNVRDHFHPDDFTEERHVRELIDAEWRLRRVRRHHLTLLTRKIAALAPLHPDLNPADLQAVAFDALLRESSTFAQLLRYETKFERQYDRAYAVWAAYQAALDRKRVSFQEDAIRSAIAPVVLRSEAESAKAILPDEPNSEPGPPPNLATAA
jgi:hypothetical protein